MAVVPPPSGGMSGWLGISREVIDKGRATFISTPRGGDQFSDIFESDKWVKETSSVATESPSFSAADMEAIKKKLSMTPEKFKGEYLGEFVGDVPKDKRKEFEKMKISKTEINKVLEPLLEQVNDLLITGTVMLTLNQPHTVTQKVGDEWKRVPMIGGETFEGLSAYMGKRDGVIFVFEVKGTEGTIEVNAGMAGEILDGFAEFVEKVVGGDLNTEVEIMRRMKQKELDEIEKLRVDELYGINSEFGVWG